MSVKFPFFWGGVWGGGGADFIFMGARISLTFRIPHKKKALVDAPWKFSFLLEEL